MKTSEKIINWSQGSEHYNIFFEIVNSKDITTKQYIEIEYIIQQKIKEFNEKNNKINRDNE
jgi:hypothetical protein